MLSRRVYGKCQIKKLLRLFVFLVVASTLFVARCACVSITSEPPDANIYAGPSPDTLQPKIKGVVRDEAGKPVEGAEVIMCPRGGSDFEATTNMEGQFDIRWDARMWSHSEMKTVYYLVARHLEHNIAAAVQIQETVRTIDIKLVKGVIFSGKVADEEGKGIENGKIHLIFKAGSLGSPLGKLGDWEKGNAVTDAQGKFEVKAIPFGHQYEIEAQADGYGGDSIKVHSDNAKDYRLDVGQFTLSLANLSDN